MSKILTYEEMMKQQHTQIAPPLDMTVFAGMLSGTPLSLTDDHSGLTYDIPLAPDVKMIFAGLVKLVAENIDKDAKLTNDEKLAYKYATRVYKASETDKPDKEVTENGN